MRRIAGTKRLGWLLALCAASSVAGCGYEKVSSEAGGAFAPGGPDAQAGTGTTSLTGAKLADDLVIGNEAVTVGIDAVGVDPVTTLATGDAGLTMQSVLLGTGGNLVDISTNENDQWLARGIAVRGTSSAGAAADPLNHLVFNFAATKDHGGQVTVKGVIVDTKTTGVSTTPVASPIGGAFAVLAGACKSAIAGSAALTAIYGTEFSQNISSAIPILVHEGTFAPILVTTIYNVPRSSRTINVTTVLRNLAGAVAASPKAINIGGFVDVVGLGAGQHRSLDVLAAGPMFLPRATVEAAAGLPSGALGSELSLQTTASILPGLTKNSFGGGTAPWVSFVGRDQNPVSYTMWDSSGALIVSRDRGDLVAIVQLSAATKAEVSDVTGTATLENQLAWSRNISVGERNDSAASADIAVVSLRNGAASVRALGTNPATGVPFSAGIPNFVRETFTLHGRLVGAPDGTVVAVSESSATAFNFFDPTAQLPTGGAQTNLGFQSTIPALPTFLGPTVPTGTGKIFSTPAAFAGGALTISDLFADPVTGKFFARSKTLSSVLRTTIRPGSDGQFACTLPTGFLVDMPTGTISTTSSTYVAKAHLPGGSVITLKTFTVNTGESAVDLGTLDITSTSSTGTLAFQILDDTTGESIPGVITILKGGTTEAVAFDIGIPTAIEQESFDTSVSGNSIMTASGTGSASLKAGTYTAVASSGLEYETDTETSFTISTGGTQALTFRLVHVVDTPDLISGDFHVHSGQSVDSSLPAVDRVRSFIATGVEILGQTEHDNVGNLDRALTHLKGERSDAAERVKLMKGVEATTDLAFIPDSSGTRQDLGHWNCFPMAHGGSTRKHGAPEDEFRTPSTLFSQLRAQDGQQGNEIVLMAHPNTAVSTTTIEGTDGFLTAMKVVLPAIPGPATVFGTSDGSTPIGSLGIQFLVDGSGLGISATLAALLKGAADFDAFEVMISGQDIAKYRHNRADWFALLDRGVIKTGLGDSDSHRVDDRFITATQNALFAGFDASHVGLPRNYLQISNARADLLSDAAVVAALAPTYETPVTATAATLAAADYAGNDGMKAFGTTGPLFTKVDATPNTGSLTTNAIGKRIAAASATSVSFDVTLEGPSWVMSHVTELRAVTGTASQTIATLTTQSATKKTASFTVTLAGGTGDVWIVLEAGQPISEITAGTLPTQTSTYAQIYPRQHVVAWTNPIFIDRDGDQTKFDGPSN